MLKKHSFKSNHNICHNGFKGFASKNSERLYPFNSVT